MFPDTLDSYTQGQTRVMFPDTLDSYTQGQTRVMFPDTLDSYTQGQTRVMLPDTLDSYTQGQTRVMLPDTVDSYTQGQTRVMLPDTVDSYTQGQTRVMLPDTVDSYTQGQTRVMLPDTLDTWVLVQTLLTDCWCVTTGAGRSSEVDRSLMVRWVVGSILHVVDPLSYFSFQPVLHNWCNKGRGMCYPVCGMVHIKEPLLLIRKSSLCGGCGFPFSLSEWFLTMSDAI